MNDKARAVELTRIIKETNRQIEEKEGRYYGAGCGFGDPDAEKGYLFDIHCLRKKEERLSRELNNLLISKIKKSTSISSWISAVIAVFGFILSVTIIVFHLK